MPARCLSFHAEYRCRHSGACCRADWEIAVAPHIVQAVQSRAVAAVFTTPAPFEPATSPSGAAIVALTRTADGHCTFRHESRCGLQTAGGEALLPAACRHFPRVILQDARGTLIALSHYCPTAASMLVDASGVSIVEAAPPLELAGVLEGLDARETLPPLLRPGMLMDLAGYAAWEHAAIRTFAARSPGAALDHLAAASERIRRWAPADGPLTGAVAKAFAAPARVQASAALSRGLAIVQRTTGPHPLIQVPDDFSEGWARLHSAAAPVLDDVISRYLAASAFANWIAYRGQGLRAIVEWLRASYDVLRLQLIRESRSAGPTREALVEALRMADLVMVHTVDSLAFGREAVALEY